MLRKTIVQFAKTCSRALKPQQRLFSKVNANTLRNGNIVEIDSKLFIVTDHYISHSAMRKSTIGIDMKDLKTGVKKQVRCHASEKFEHVELESLSATFLYRQGETLVFMDPTSFEQFELESKVAGEKTLAYMSEGLTNIRLEKYKDKFISIQLPVKVACQVKETKDRSDNAEKIAVLTNGRRVKVSAQVNSGDWVNMRPADETFAEKIPPPKE
eukprot:TRINITY_DN1968_c0_g1_i1.p1 TRINITY_DN1968_c0_g1~~TRINITY_DN1968_c0_g1_i1.p1  ORF type:complete len:213 (-),score=47.34 TRINITY_DN1968_c0_g1_i1:143-781(-)